MSASDRDWLKRGAGRRPRLSWSLSTDAPLVALQLARETGEVLAGDALGGLYLIDRQGKLSSLVRGKPDLRGLAWSDTGQGGAALLGDRGLYWFNRQLVSLGSVELPANSVALAMEAHGRYVAVSLSDGFTLLYDSYRKRVRHFETPQPLISLAFLAHQPALVGVAEYGFLYCCDFAGDPLWNEKLWANVAQLAADGVGEQILLACFNHGVQVHDLQGEQLGTYQVPGTVNVLATSFAPDHFAVGTQERQLFWLNKSGQIEWQVELPDELCRLAVDPLGLGLVAGFKSGRVVRLDWT